MTNMTNISRAIGKAPATGKAPAAGPRARRQAGFTLPEVLAALGIMVALLGIAFVIIWQTQLAMRQLEMDATAKEIFMAAQNHLSLAESQGLLDNDQATPVSTGAMDDEGAHYFVYNPTTSKDSVNHPDNKVSALNLMLPFGSIDQTVRTGGSYVIRYQPATGLVLDVFYVDDYSFTSADYAGLMAVRGQDKADARKPFDPDGANVVIGWYGGETGRAAGLNLQAPTIQVQNGDVLAVKVTNPDRNTNLLRDYNQGKAAADQASMQLRLIVTGKTSGAQMYFDLDPIEAGIVEKFGNTYTVVLDDVTTTAGRFWNVGEARVSAGKGQGTFQPGEDLQMYALASGTVWLGAARSATVTTNSLFASGKALGDGSVLLPSTYSASVSSLRHLMNLSGGASHFGYQMVSAPLGVGGASRAMALATSSAYTAVLVRQTTDLTWDGFVQSFAAPESITYLPVTPDPAYALRYNGNGYAITGVTAASTGDAGLFALLPDGSSVKDLELVEVTATSTEGAAGALAGATQGDVSVSHVLARVDLGNAGTTRQVAGATAAGGLVGHMQNGTLNGCAATLLVQASGGPAGGLVGACDAATITDSYASGRTSNGAYDADNLNVVSSSAAAGGLVGACDTATITRCYSTASAAGATAVGGLVGALTGGSVSNSYATGLVNGPDSTAGALVGTGGAALDGCAYYRMVNQTVSDGVAVDLPAVGNQANAEGAQAFDRSLAAFNAFATAERPATAYDERLALLYQGTYYLRTVSQLSGYAPVGHATAKVKEHLTTHFGDWPAPETLVPNQLPNTGGTPAATATTAATAPAATAATPTATAASAAPARATARTTASRPHTLPNTAGTVPAGSPALNWNNAVCKIVDSAGAHPFDTVQDAIEYAATTTAVKLPSDAYMTIQMLKDYEPASSERITVPAGVEVTITTATSAYSSDGHYYTGWSGKATFSRSFTDTDRSLITVNGTLLLDNVSLDGKRWQYSGGKGGLLRVEQESESSSLLDAWLFVNDSVQLRDSQSAGDGGAIWAGSRSHVILRGAISNCAASGNGGAVYGESGSTVMMYPGASITSCSASRGAAVYVSGGNGRISYFYMTGGSITNNTSSNANSGAVAVNGSNTRLVFSGAPIVQYNYVNGASHDVCLSSNNNGVINSSGASGLESGAYIGVYVPNGDDYFEKHGGANDPFGTYVSDANLSCFVNNRNSLRGAAGDGNRIVWRQAVPVEVRYASSMAFNSEAPSDYQVLYSGEYVPSSVPLSVDQLAANVQAQHGSSFSGGTSTMEFWYGFSENAMRVSNAVEQVIRLSADHWMGPGKLAYSARNNGLYSLDSKLILYYTDAVYLTIRNVSGHEISTYNLSIDGVGVGNLGDYITYEQWSGSALSGDGGAVVLKVMGGAGKTYQMSGGFVNSTDKVVFSQSDKPGQNVVLSTSDGPNGAVWSFHLDGTLPLAGGLSNATIVQFGEGFDPVGERDVILRKTDADSYRSLAGAVFTVYRANNTTVAKDVDGTELRDLESGANGVFFVGRMSYGTYKLRETTRPAGYGTGARTFTLIVDDYGARIIDAVDGSGSASGGSLTDDTTPVTNYSLANGDREGVKRLTFSVPEQFVGKNVHVHFQFDGTATSAYGGNGPVDLVDGGTGAVLTTWGMSNPREITIEGNVTGIRSITVETF